MLVVEDEAKLASLLRQGLRRRGMGVDLAGTGEEAVMRATTTDYDVILLDVMLPGYDGFEVCRRLRDHEVWSPTLMLTALDDVEDRVRGLDSGADDYLAKPFSFEELLARMRALVRRGSPRRPTLLTAGELRFDPGGAARVARGRGAIADRAGIRDARAVHAPAGRGPDAGSSCSSTCGTTATRTART